MRIITVTDWISDRIIFFAINAREQLVPVENQWLPDTMLTIEENSRMRAILYPGFSERVVEGNLPSV